MQPINNLMRSTPDGFANMASVMSLANKPDRAFRYTVAAMRSRALWVLVNGKWTPRKGVMRGAG